MRAVDAYSRLRGMQRPIVTTSEAETRWQTSARTTGKRLRTLEDAGLVRRLRRGLWALQADIAPFAVAPFLTAPLPAYVSLWSALAHHGLIEEIPRRISVASLARPERITTTVGVFQIHHLAPEVFGGFDGSEETGYVASVEKALFDTVYVRAAAGSRAYLPELTLPAGFDDAEVTRWTDRIAGSRLQTMLRRRLSDAIKQAEREAASD